MKTLEGKISSSGNIKGPILKTDDPFIVTKLKEYILVTRNADPEMSRLIYESRGIITECGGLLSHLAVVSREINIPCIVSCKGSYDLLTDKEIVYLNAKKEINETGVIYYDL